MACFFHNAQGHRGSEAYDLYTDQMLSFAPALRWIPPKLDTIEIEASPLYTFAPELYNHSLNQLGLRFVVVWHIDSFIRGKIAEKERIRQEEIAKQQRLERERQDFDDDGFDILSGESAVINNHVSITLSGKKFVDASGGSQQNKCRICTCWGDYNYRGYFCWRNWSTCNGCAFVQCIFWNNQFYWHQ